jgi:iron(III) transport system permease protein
MIAWLAALAISLGDLAASILVVPPGVTTLSIRIFGLLHYGVEDQVAGICLAMLLVFTVLAGTVYYLAVRISRSKKPE